MIVNNNLPHIHDIEHRNLMYKYKEYQNAVFKLPENFGISLLHKHFDLKKQEKVITEFTG